MAKLHTLTAIVDEVNESRLFGKPLDSGRRATLSRFLAERQGKPGAYGGLFAPMDDEIADGYRFFTGEHINTNAGSRHILGEEALRALVLLRPKTGAANAAIDRAVDWLNACLRQSETRRDGCGVRGPGMFCCMRCSIAIWRVLALGVAEAPDDRLRGGMKNLRARRDGHGAWRGFPFYYTLSALLEADNSVARAELRYAQPAIESRLKRARKDKDDLYAQRQHVILERLAAMM